MSCMGLNETRRKQLCFVDPTTAANSARSWFQQDRQRLVICGLGACSQFRRPATADRVLGLHERIIREAHE